MRAREKERERGRDRGGRGRETDRPAPHLPPQSARREADRSERLYSDKLRAWEKQEREASSVREETAKKESDQRLKRKRDLQYDLDLYEPDENSSEKRDLFILKRAGAETHRKARVGRRMRRRVVGA